MTCARIRDLAAFLLCAASVVSQTTWDHGLSIEGRWLHAMAYDSNRGRAIVFGGHARSGFDLGDVWEWSGRRWMRLADAAGSPRPRREPAIAYDRNRGRLVLFGGTVGSTETWEWDGLAWERKSPATTPEQRQEHAMAFDEARGRTVLFGGNWFSPLADTWEWDGAQWTQHIPTVSPPAMRKHAMAYDAARQRVVLFGQRQTWEWDGTTWSQRASAPASAPRSGHGIAYDRRRQRVVVYGGGGTSTPLGDTWEWNGSQWSLRTTANRPPALTSAALAYDEVRGRVVLFGGLDGNLIKSNETWDWDGTNWSRASAPPSGLQMLPGDGVAMAAMAATAGGDAILFGGQHYNVTGARFVRYDDTWIWRDRAWSLAQPASRPAARFGHAMATDFTRDRVVVFGGSVRGGLQNDTWEWDGTNWRAIVTATSPSPRAQAAMAHEPVGQRLLLFGGDNGLIGDTWAYDGTAWTALQPANAPAGRVGHAMVSDPLRGRVVLFGGRTATRWLSDTWEWNGTTWLSVLSPVTPPARAGHSLTYDYGRGRIVLAFGEAGGAPLGDVWELDGSTWTRMALRLGVGPRRDHAAASSNGTGQIVMCGGHSGEPEGELNDTWVYRGGAVAPFGAGCGVLGRAPRIEVPSPQVPAIGETLVLALTSLQSGVSTGAIALGLSSRLLGTVPLPLALGFAGMPGCWLYHSAETAVGFASANGRALWGAPLPASASLVGATVYAQAFELVPIANPAGVLSTHALALTIGPH